MRKDVRFGLAIGGILLALMVIYALSGRTGKHAEPVQIVDQEGKAIDTPIADQAPAPAAQPPTDVFADSTSSPNPTRDVWAAAFRTGQIPRLMNETPATAVAPVSEPVAVAGELARTLTPTSPTPAAHATEVALGPTTQPSPALDPQPLLAPPATQPVSGERQHKVANGETLSSIAAATYGSRNYWPHIARRNPSLDPTRLKVGMLLILPDPATVKAPIDPVAKAGSVGTAVRPVDAGSEYRVQESDSLYRISMKLYGKADHVDKLYEWNKQSIGPDPRKLKVGMVLKLQEPPSSSAAAN